MWNEFEFRSHRNWEDPRVIWYEKKKSFWSSSRLEHLIFLLFLYVRVVQWRVTNRANQASGHANYTLEFNSVQMSTLMRRFYLEVDKPMNIKPDTLVLTTSITYNVHQAKRGKNLEKLLVFPSYRLIQITNIQIFPFSQNLSEQGTSLCKSYKQGFKINYVATRWHSSHIYF
jgi:hypothetical protein